MVKLNKIYTRTGDKGQTGLVDGSRVDKHDLRPSAFGAVDELNAQVGLCRVYATDGDIEQHLSRIQHDLFDLGADLATPFVVDEKTPALRLTTRQVERLESEIDIMNRDLSPLNSFVLPGGSILSSHLHLARVSARRGERAITRLAAVEPIGEFCLPFINRLSDYFFVLGRFMNNKGLDDILWQPHKNG